MGVIGALFFGRCLTLIDMCSVEKLLDFTGCDEFKLSILLYTPSDKFDNVDIKTDRIRPHLELQT